MDKRQKILIVDDAKLNRDILKEILGDTYNYLEAENGNQAIQMIAENIGIDLMLLDINMPQMNGFEVLEIMKESQCRKMRHKRDKSGKILGNRTSLAGARTRQPFLM